MTLFGILTPTGWVTRFAVGGLLMIVDVPGLAYSWKTREDAEAFNAAEAGTAFAGVVTEIPTWVLR